MKHVGSAARPGFRVLVTAFGAFPGSPVNPTLAIAEALAPRRPDLARTGADLRLAVMPVVYADITTSLSLLVEMHRPDAILHLGLAGRRSSISVETRAVNRSHPSHPDAAGALPSGPVLEIGGPAALTTTYPAADILRAIRKTGVPARRSISAGTYVCNATLFHALRATLAPQIGFLHVPHPDPARSTGIAALARAVEAAIEVMARHAAAAVPMALPTAAAPAAR